jgi:hypothetical protein
MVIWLEYIPELLWWWPADVAGHGLEDDEAFFAPDGEDPLAALHPALRFAPPALFLCPGERAPLARAVRLKGSQRDH